MHAMRSNHVMFFSDEPNLIIPSIIFDMTWEAGTCFDM